VESAPYRREEEEYLLRGKCKKNMAAGGEMGGKNVKMPRILGCEKNGPNSKCAFE
jgi:hypothetical protein